ncbi:MAG: hypothetical protein IH626_09355 [Rhodospirillales bacterium]|nr:hypothetical protein [Rhodospirillales bacterium]
MNEQKFFCGEATGPSDLMAAWLASGGAADAQLDAHAAHSRQRGAGSDDGLAAGTPTTGGPECPGAWVNDGLQAHRYTTYGDCVEDELLAGGPTRYVYACIPIDDGLQASAPTGLHPMCRGGL